MNPIGDGGGGLNFGCVVLPSGVNYLLDENNKVARSMAAKAAEAAGPSRMQGVFFRSDIPPEFL